MSKRGRKSLFRDDIIASSERMAGYGLTEAQIANVFCVNPCTLIRWKKLHPEFDNALKRGADIANEKVVHSLYMNALGGFRTGIRERFRKGEMVEKHETFAPPNTTAQIFWLKNRLPEQWRDKHEVAGSGFGDTTIHVHPNKTLIFTALKDEANANDGTATDIHAGEGASSNRV